MRIFRALYGRIGLSRDGEVGLISVGADAFMPDLLDALIPADIERRPLDTEGPLHKTANYPWFTTSR